MGEPGHRFHCNTFVFDPKFEVEKANCCYYPRFSANHCCHQRSCDRVSNFGIAKREARRHKWCWRFVCWWIFGGFVQGIANGQVLCSWCLCSKHHCSAQWLHLSRKTRLHSLKTIPDPCL